ncbi:MAG: hypothetical protein PQJ59_09640 [Spirochaetales bacterium]|nr:hypothetical protein [Spirochaetales bacterium]
MNRKILFAIPLFLLLLFSFYLKGEQKRLEQVIGRKKRELIQLREVQAVDESDILAMETNYLWGLSRYRKEKNINLFSQSVKEELLDQGLTLIRYQKQNEREEDFIEFTVEGRPLYFFNFLERFTVKSQAFTVPRFSLTMEEGHCRITFLIGLDVINEDLASDLPLTEGYEWSEEIGLTERESPYQLERLFYTPPVKRVVRSVPEEPAPVVQTEKLDFQYVGKVSLDGNDKYYLKEKGKNKIYTVPSLDFSLIEVDRTQLLFMHNDRKYEVGLE